MKLPVYLIRMMVLLSCWPGGVVVGWANTLPPRLTTNIDTAQITVGERITLTVTVTCPLEAKVAWPSLSQALNGWEVLDEKVMKTSGPGKWANYRLKITLTSFVAGTQAIPSLPVTVFTAQDTCLLASTLVPIQCHLLPVELTRPFKEIHPSVIIGYTPAELLPYQLGAGLVALLLLLSLGYRKVPLRWAALSHRGPAYYRQAIRDLDKLEKTGDIPTQLPVVLRTYLTNRFGIPAKAATTKEILRQLQMEKLVGDQLHPIRTVFRATDQAKFDRDQPFDPPALLALLEQTRKFVQATKPLN